MSEKTEDQNVLTEQDQILIEQKKELLSQSVSTRIAQRYGVDPGKLIQTLKLTAFRQSGDHVISNEQMMALMIVADQHQLNPFTNEIYAFPSKGGGIVPVVGVDGWSRIANAHSQYDGVEFVYADEWQTMPGAKPCPAWIECRISRKDRAKPIVVREYLDETYQPAKECKSQFQNGSNYFVNGPWQTTTKRQLRHKSFIQGCRIAFSFSGIYDQDEAEKIIAGEALRDASGVVNKFEEAEVIVPENLTLVVDPVLTDERKSEIDLILGKLVERSIKMKSFAPAKLFLNTRFVADELIYAQSILEQSERAHAEYSGPIPQVGIVNNAEAFDAVQDTPDYGQEAA